jgi:hypothetical protein
MPLTLASNAITFTDNTVLSSGIIGTAQLSAGAVTADKIISLPNNIVTTAAIAASAITPVKLSQPLTLGTAKAFNWNGSSSNTFIDFENIPSWARRITLMFSGMSTAGVTSQPPIVRLGTATQFEATGYASGGAYSGVSSTGAGTNSTGLLLGFGLGTAEFQSGIFTLILLDPSTNLWVSTSIAGFTTTNYASMAGGSRNLSSPLTRIRLTTESNLLTFDSGNFNIMYEG